MSFTIQRFCSLIVMLCIFTHAPLLAVESTWTRHTIDDSSQGADGVRLLDVNGDQRLDITTGWEEGGKIRVYLNPGPGQVKEKWPRVDVGNVASPEDAFFCDIDNDGSVDVVSCCEGKNRSVFFHWAPRDPNRYLDEQAWTTTVLPCVEKKQMWMYGVPLQVDGKHGIDLVVGAKGSGATVGWLESPANPREVDQWVYHPIYQAGWIMSLRLQDMDRDGDLDVLLSDRKGSNRGVKWLENPGTRNAVHSQKWSEHQIGGPDHEWMFLTYGDLNGDGIEDVVCATRNKEIVCFFRNRAGSDQWSVKKIENPFGIPHGKAVEICDIDLDGQLDLVHTTNKHDQLTSPGVSWLKFTKGFSPHHEKVVDVEVFDVSGTRGVKFDRVETVDLDSDGDLDIITCEERDNLGVFWYENPTR